MVINPLVMNPALTRALGLPCPIPRKALTGNGRSGEIRTPDPLLPKQVRYQAALHSVWLKASYIDKRGRPRNKAFVGRSRGAKGLACVAQRRRC